MSNPQPEPISKLPAVGGNNPFPTLTDLVAVSIYVSDKYGPGVGGWKTFRAPISQIVGSGAALTPNRRTITSTGNILLTSADTFVFLNKSDTANTTLPSSTDWLAMWEASGFDLEISDVSGGASVNNQTLLPASGEKFNGVLNSLTIDSDFGGYRFKPSPNGGWIVR